MSVIVNIAHCAEHFRGGDRIGRMSGQEHAEWLEEAVVWWLKHSPWPILVSITGWAGWPSVEVGPGYYERDVYWRIWVRPRVRFVTMPQNPGHQVGAGWCIRLGLEAASKLGMSVMIHTAEDVLPGPGALSLLTEFCGQGVHDYLGEAWGRELGVDELSSQFFAVRVQALVGTFDPPAVTGAGHLELYMRQQLEGKRVRRERLAYRHTHDFREWKEWAKEQG